MMKEVEANPEIKIIRSPAIANELLKRGFKIVSLKPHLSNRYKTVFVFEWSEDFQLATNELMTN